ncbi:MAG: hypothetical protein ACI4VJ_05965 [Methanosphaera sp.]
MTTSHNKIKTQTKAEITDSDTHMFTVHVTVTEQGTGKPVTKGKVTIKSKKGKIIGTGKIKEGTADITASITNKNYKLTIIYEGTEHTYDESVTKIDFQKEYLFYKTSSYLWIAIIAALIIIVYTIGLYTLLITAYPQSQLAHTLSSIIPYVAVSNTTMQHFYLANLHYLQFFVNILIWILIISFITAGVYATQFNSNFHNIIRKNVTNHSIFQHFFGLIIVILMIITIITVIIA